MKLSDAAIGVLFLAAAAVLTPLYLALARWAWAVLLTPTGGTCG